MLNIFVFIDCKNVYDMYDYGQVIIKKYVSN